MRTLIKTHGRIATGGACFILFFLLAPLALRAQPLLGIGVGATTLALTPSSPEAGERFEARVEAYAYDITKARISWNVNGTVLKEYENEQAITLNAPALGVLLAISVRVTETNGAAHTAAVTLVPSALDLIVESDTRVPYFYKGRALPSAGSAIRLIALPTLYTKNGTLADQNDIIYTWRIDGTVVKTGLGRNTLATMMSRNGSLLVEVETQTSDGSARHASIRRIAAAEPQNLFYEDNPLYGLSQNALPAEFTLLQDEISIRAEPYFVSRDIFNNAVYEWTLDGTAVQNPNADPQTLTLRKTGGEGAARIAFSVRNLQSLLQSAAGVFTVYFEN